MPEQTLVNLGHLETLLDLERRHEELLAELDTLDRRVSTVLSEVRASLYPGTTNPPGPEVPASAGNEPSAVGVPASAGNHH